MDFHDRFLLAYTQLVIIFERRDSFLSDDDVFNTAEAYSPDTEDPNIMYEHLVEHLQTI